MKYIHVRNKRSYFKGKKVEDLLHIKFTHRHTPFLGKILFQVCVSLQPGRLGSSGKFPNIGWNPSYWKEGISRFESQKWEKLPKTNSEFMSEKMVVGRRSFLF